jgi:hypothetical protein
MDVIRQGGFLDVDTHGVWLTDPEVADLLDALQPHLGRGFYSVCVHWRGTAVTLTPRRGREPEVLDIIRAHLGRAR